jgi:hypothetical protein
VITLACVNCLLAMRTTGEFSEVDYLIGIKCDWYPDRYPCPRSGCFGKMTLTDVIEPRLLDQLEVHDLTPQEVFQALQGMGLPKERACTVEDVHAVLHGQRVIFLDLQSVPNSTRSVLHSFTMESGQRVFLGSSPQGAVVYRIAPPRQVAKEVLGEG